MKHFLLTVLLLASALTAMADDSEWKYTDARNFLVLGKLTPDTAEPFSRFPACMEEGMREKLWQLGRCSSGVFIRFNSDAGEFMARWTTIGRLDGDNMTYILKAGMALYVRDKGEWVFVGSFRPGRFNPDQLKEFKISCTKLKGHDREYMLYLGAYDGFLKVELGIPEGCHIGMPRINSPRAEYPVIVYGTSVTQGASASHAGMVGTNIMSRRLDRVVMNLGFSNNGRLDLEVARFMASYPSPGAYVLHHVGNCTPELIYENQEAFYRILREAHPDTPIIFVGMCLPPRVRFDHKGAENILARREAMIKVFKKLKKEGEKNIYYVSEDKLDLIDKTVEGTHWTDKAFEQWAERLCRVLKRRIKVGKTLRMSIIGDSISTFEDMIPEGNRVYKKYRRDSCLVNWTNTYWGRLVTRYQPSALALEKNISWSGSCVAQDSRSGQRYTPSFVTRYGKGDNIIGKPDLVLIHGGTNDRSLKLLEVFEIPPEEAFREMFSKPLKELDTLSFAQSYVKLVRMVHKDRPSAKILCLIGDHISAEQAQSIRTIADHYKFVEYVDFNCGGEPNPAISKVYKSHPDSAGMDYMASEINRRLLELGWVK